MSRSALLLLADTRLPAGGHAHSGGLEAAVADRRVTSLAQLEAFLRGRLATAGLVAAGFAATACRARLRGENDVTSLDEALDARTPAPALRRTSRTQGRALLRAGRAMYPIAVEHSTGGPHHPVALGVVAAAAGLAPDDAALVAAYGAVTGPASAAVRLLALDPYAVQAVLAGLAAECDGVAARAAAMEALPAATAPLLDISAEVHASWEVRLFAS